MRRVMPLALLLALASTAPARAAEERGDVLIRALERKVMAIAEKASPSVVCIYVSRSDLYYKAPYWGTPDSREYPGQLGTFDAGTARKKVPTDAKHYKRILRTIAEHDLADPNVVPEAFGSGIVVDRKGLVLTCAHVVKNATRLYVRLPGRRGSWANIYASDPRSDLAVLKLLDPPDDLEALELSKGANVRQGQFVLSLSNGFAPGFRPADQPTLSYGLISGLQQAIPLPNGLENTPREKITLHHYGTLIQTNAQTTPSCSGGALLGLDGTVIGLSNALAGVRGDQSGGFAIPIEARTRRIIDVLKRGEEVEYGFLGVGVNSRWPGTRVSQITPGSPAQKAGLMVGDRIVSINGHAVRGNNDLFLDLGLTLAGKTARIEVARGGVTRTYSVTLAKYYVPGPVVAANRPPARFGLRVDYTSIPSQRNPFLHWGRGPGEGVAIREVVPGSPADKARLQPDKIITQVNGKDVRTPAAFYKEMAQAGDKVELTYLNSQNRPERITLSR